MSYHQAGRGTIDKVYTLRLDEDFISLRPSENLVNLISDAFEKYPVIRAITFVDGDNIRYGRRGKKRPELTDFAGKLRNGEKIKIKLTLDPYCENAEGLFTDFDAFFGKTHPHTESTIRRLGPHRN